MSYEQTEMVAAVIVIVIIIGLLAGWILSKGNADVK